MQIEKDTAVFIDIFLQPFFIRSYFLIYFYINSWLKIIFFE